AGARSLAKVDIPVLGHVLCAGLATLGQGINRSADRLPIGVGVSVNGNEEISVLAAGEADAILQRNIAVSVPRQRDAILAAAFKRLAQLQRSVQDDILLAHASGPDGARVATAVAGVDDDGAPADARALARLGRCERGGWGEVEAQLRRAPAADILAQQLGRRFEVEDEPGSPVGLRSIAVTTDEPRARPLPTCPLRQRQARVGEI